MNKYKIVTLERKQAICNKFEGFFTLEQNTPTFKYKVIEKILHVSRFVISRQSKDLCTEYMSTKPTKSFGNTFDHLCLPVI